MITAAVLAVAAGLTPAVAVVGSGSEIGPATAPETMPEVLRRAVTQSLTQEGDGTWWPLTKLTPSDGGQDGLSFAWELALEGDTALVGVGSHGITPPGAAYVFIRGTDGTWSEQAKLIPSDEHANDQFGEAVALSVDGDVALVGAHRHTVAGNTQHGAAYVFVRNTEGMWSEQAKLLPDIDLPPLEDLDFGSSVALSADGSSALVGAPHYGSDDNPEPNRSQGAAYVFVRDGDTWSEQAVLLASDWERFDDLGQAVALSADGDTATAMVWRQLEPPNASPKQVMVYVFGRNGSNWTELATLVPSDDPIDVAVFSDHGALAISDDAETVIVGGWPVGKAAYVFVRDAEGTWSEQARLTTDDAPNGEFQFGVSVTLSGDTAVVGANGVPVDGEDTRGAAYVFQRDGEGVWSEPNRLTTCGASRGAGFAVALSDDTVLVSQGGDSCELGGSAYVFVDSAQPPEVAAVEGTVRGLGRCGVGAAPLPGAQVQIAGAESTVILDTVPNGSYHTFLPTSEGPVDITVTGPGRLPATVEGIDLSAGGTAVQDFDLVLDAPCASADPISLSVELHPGQSSVETLTVGNVDGAAELEWTIATAAPAAPRRGSGGRKPTADPSAGRSSSEETVHRSESVGAGGAMDLASILGDPLPGLRPRQPAGGVVDCDDEPGIIIHDDGAIESAYSANPMAGVDQVIFADRFTPSAYPASFRSLCVAFLSQGPPSLEFEIVLFDDDGPDGSPGTELGALAVTAELDVGPPFPPEPAWESYDISSLGITIDSGSVYIGARWAPSIPNVFVAADQSTDRPVGFAGGFWWTDVSGAWTPTQDAFPSYRSLFLRAVESEPTRCDDPSTVPWLSVLPDGGTTPAGDATPVEVTVDAAALDEGEYVADLCIATSDAARSRIVVRVNLAVISGGLIFDPHSLDFGNVEVDATSLPQSVTLHNTGELDATGMIFDLSGSGFDVATGTCADALPVGGSCEVGVTFAPVELGPAAATLEVHSSEGAVAFLSLTGSGVEEGSVTAMALDVDWEALASNGNGVLEPGELVDVAPAWRNEDTEPQFLSGHAANFSGSSGANYVLVLDDADYGEVEAGEVAGCRQTEVCYRLGVNNPSSRPATHWEATFEETLVNGATKTWTLHVGDSFTDVPRPSPFYGAVETLLHAGVTRGCSDTEYCPAGGNTRAQMAVFLLRAVEGGAYSPPACAEGDEQFIDVPFDHPFCPWIGELVARGVTSGCGGGNYCPGASVTRAQMAIFLLKTLEGDGYSPPECSNRFTDVPCPSLFADWIEELAAREITGGCSATEYCPDAPVSRAQMATFVTRTFDLTLYGP